MGNCQAAEAAAVVIQHPGGKVERLYGAATAGEVMRSNPGHYVALVVLRVSGVGANKPESGGGGGGAKITKVKLLKAKDTLMLGQVYRLITSQAEIDELIKNPFPNCFSEVAKAIQARRQDKTRRCEEALDDDRRPGHDSAAAGGDAQGQSGADQVVQNLKRAEKERSRGRSGGGVRGRHWRPSLQSITESAS
ncbi:hypothetical protein HU200_005211 [Digitaria exilis]|uniref:Uncharacterized protein n=1 Tax=Digitaria exilis TaxID=1010633 RepID=A0A835FS57_9POAL|nr:hypothetical protein HU200_005211 [Digitaria exilis]